MAQQKRPRLSLATKAVYGFGDHTINFSLASLSFLYPFFLTDIVGMQAAYAALIPLLARFVDAWSDPLMGRISDNTRGRFGRRRPYFLLGMAPFGFFYAACWWNSAALPEGATFGYYAGAYVLFCLAKTIVAVPYLAIGPEMTSNYDERTSLNAFRGIGGIVGALLAASAIRPVAGWLGEGAQGFQYFGICAGVYVALVWPLVHRFTFERPVDASDAQAQKPASLWRSLGALINQHSFQRITGFFLLTRIAIDLMTTMLIYYFTWYIGRSGDFEIVLFVFLVSAAVAMPVWSGIAKRFNKHVVFITGCLSWIGTQALLFTVQPDWPAWIIYAGAALGGFGYAAADMMPWSMLGEVVDEDEYQNGERREGLYFGFFMFLRKLGGALAAALALLALDFAGYVEGGAEAQSATVISTIHTMASLVPAAFIAGGALVARGFPLTRARHAEIMRALQARREGAP